MTVEGLRIERDGRIATVTLDRPGLYNSISFVMWQALAKLFKELAEDKTIRGVIITGGGTCFSSGADIADFDKTRATPEQCITYEEAVDEACDAIAALGCPVIAAIRSYCYGGACNIAMACDFRFVGQDAKISIPAAKLSIVYSARGMARLVSLVGVSEAKRIFYTAAPFDAMHAKEIGFADAIEFDPVAAAKAWLEDVVHLAPLSIAGSKAIINMIAMGDEPFDPALADSVTWQALISEDYIEGRAAFAAKRPPDFKGK